jgi:hypothetical protein
MGIDAALSGATPWPTAGIGRFIYNDLQKFSAIATPHKPEMP